MRILLFITVLLWCGLFLACRDSDLRRNLSGEWVIESIYLDSTEVSTQVLMINTLRLNPEYGASVPCELYTRTLSAEYLDWGCKYLNRDSSLLWFGDNTCIMQDTFVISLYRDERQILCMQMRNDSLTFFCAKNFSR